MTTPLVSICSITYNHSRFIRQCLDSLLMQKTNFLIEIIINDDCSTDGTTEILREYEQKYPDIVFPVYQEKNVYSQGVRGLFNRFVFPKVRGKYVAICEGDDYWIDPYKLQKQVDFLEAHPDYSICYHKVQIVNADASEIKGYYPFGVPDVAATFSVADMEQSNIIQTNSVMYRWRFHAEKLLDYVWPGIMPNDWMLHLVHAMVGKVYYMPEVMGAYRHHEGGIWSMAHQDGNSFWLNYGYAHMLFFKNAQEVTKMRFDVVMHHVLENVVKACLLNWNPDVFGKVRKLYPDDVQRLLESYLLKDNSKRACFAREYVEAMVKYPLLYRLTRILWKLFRFFMRK